ncbi:MAG TPA: signal recognition particle-docking protein FtsY [Halanaerobiaceae bacterium]|jgi:fused signal recognition particle receptor|nr:signal recognition particle-docking protein FtsY [Bacillota bacterium]HHU93248.1 signal recognition particle-docking protein FtsY [Halanaerobiaceae bacterium]
MLNFFKRDKDKKTEKLEEVVENKNIEQAVEAPANEKKKKQSLFSRLKSGLTKTRDGFINQVSSLFSSYTRIDEELFEELEEILIQADVGVQTTMQLVEELEERVDEEGIKDPEELNHLFREQLTALLQTEDGQLDLAEGLNIFMVVGVNGVGKTTTIAKLAQRFKNEGKNVLLAAGDTFRAAAIDQLRVWSERIGVGLIAQQEGSDAAAVAYDAVQAAKAREVDLLIVDTAGRLHTQKNLMEELKKVKRVIEREGEGCNIQVLLVLDATTGQNAINQARLFHEAINVDAIALTKLDGTAKGGIVVAIKNELGLPIKLIGVGEAAEDLQDFQAEEFVKALFSD